MKRVFVEAFEDESRPQGGHAVLVIQGLEAITDRPTFRLKPLDGSFIAGKRSGPRSNMLTPVATRLTENGVELVVGPDIVSNPLLLAGTPVVVELPDSGVRGEFLWPNVAPLAPPRRRNVVVARKSRPSAGGAAPPADVAAPAGIPVARELGLKTLEPSGTPGEMMHGASGKETDALSAAGAVADEEPGQESGQRLVDPDVPARAAAAAPSDFQRTTSETEPFQWKGRQATGRAWRRRWLAPGAAALGAMVLAGFYLLPAQTSGPGSTAAIARDTSRPAEAPKPKLRADNASGSRAAPQGGHADGDTTVAGLTSAGTASLAHCAKPEISTDPLDGGRMRIRISAPCKGDEEVRLAYGGGTFIHRLDSGGSLDLVFDCFAGPAGQVEVRFADGRTRSLPVVADDFQRISKVAVVWKASVNLDLHAFEYAALPSERGHVFERASSTSATALREKQASRRGRGFMSTIDSGRSLGDKLEVYTFFHSEEQTSGTVDFALDFESRGENPAAGTCGTGENAEVPFKVSLLARGSLSVEDGRIAAAECGQPIKPEHRYNRGALPVIKVRR